jgi:hypothetical protein
MENLKVSDANLHICAPPAIERKIFADACPDCGKRSRFLCWLYEWYGWEKTCIKCGRRWADGEWMPLEFERGARQKSIARAKEKWRKESLSRMGR